MEEIQEEKGYNKWEWFFYMIMIPALFATILGGILLSLLGYDIIGKLVSWGNSIPYVEKIVPGGSDEANGGAKRAEDPVVKMQAELTSSKQELTALKKEAGEKDAVIQQLNQQVKDLQTMLEEKRADDEERQKQYQDLAKLYATMSARNAAAILENLALEEAVTVLAKMKPEQRADILAKMTPKKAADISILIKDTVISKDEDIAALQQRINTLAKALSETRTQNGTSMDALVTTFSQMQANDAGTILGAMMTTDPSRALSILANMSNEKRAEVLSAISRQDKNLAARITSRLLR